MLNVDVIEIRRISETKSPKFGPFFETEQSWMLMMVVLASMSFDCRVRIATLGENKSTRMQHLDSLSLPLPVLCLWESVIYPQPEF